MARGQDINSGTSQFYVNTISNRGLDGSYTVFGMVISGLDVVDKIAALPTTTQYSSLPQPVNPSQAMLIGVTILNP
jgi:cyclophilin family peptidyl-prolyl cis-trans isomerase